MRQLGALGEQTKRGKQEAQTKPGEREVRKKRA
jgi:hypothetical protein